MKRILLMVFRNIILVPYMWCRLCYHASHTEKYTEEEQYSLLKFIVLRANKGGNVRIEPYGTENIPKESGFMFFSKPSGSLRCACRPGGLPNALFSGRKEGNSEHSVSKTGFCMYESIYAGQG